MKKGIAGDEEDDEMAEMTELPFLHVVKDWDGDDAKQLSTISSVRGSRASCSKAQE